MIDLHTHSLLSDGQYLPDELVRRCEMQGYSRLVITEHIGFSNAETVIPQVARMCRALRGKTPVRVKPGAEITHVPPELIARAVTLVRKAGAQIVLGHGETLVEPIASGTNRAFIEAGVDVLAHPGLITREDAELAARKGVALEITPRRGHSLTNGHVCLAARATGAKLVFGSDGHGPGEYPTRAMAEKVALGAGLTPDEIADLFANAKRIFDRRPRRGRR